MNRLFALLTLFFLLKGLPVCGQHPEISFQLGHHTGVSRMICDRPFSSLFSADKEGNIIHWDIASGRQVRMFASPGEPVNDLLLLENEKKLVALYQHRLVVWDISGGKPLQEQVFNEKNALKKVLPFKTGWLVAGLHEMYVCSAGLEIQKTFRYDGIFAEPGQAPDPAGNTFEVKLKKETEDDVSGDFFGGIFISEDEKQVSYAVFPVNYHPRYRGIYTIDSETFALVKKEKWFDPFFIKMSPDKKSLYRLSMPGRQMIKKGEWPEKPLSKQISFAASATRNFISAYDAGNRYVCFGDVAGTIVVSRANNNQHLYVLKGHDHKITQVTLSADEKYLMTADEKGLVLMWDLGNGKLVRPFSGTAHAINTLLYNPQGNQLALGFSNGEVKLWDLFSNEQKKLVLRATNGKDMLWSVLKIDEIKNDSIVYFRCKASDEKNVSVYDAVWNVYSDAVLLTEFALNDKEAEKVALDTIVTNKGQRISHKGNDLLLLGQDSAFTRITSGHSASISDIAYNSRYDFYTTAGQDGILKSWKEGSPEALFTSGCMGERGYFHILPEGHYFADKGSLRYLSFRISEKIYPFEQFDVLFNRPDLVMKKFPFADSTLVQSFEKAYEKRKKRLKSTMHSGWEPEDAPLVEINHDHLAAENGVYTLQVSARAKKSPLQTLYIEVNGVPETVMETGPVPSIEKTYTIQLNDGLNRITVYAENMEGIFSLRDEISVKNTQHKTPPSLYIISIGSGTFSDSSMALKYAAKDAEDIAQLFGQGKHQGKVIKQLYTGRQVNKNILPEIEKYLSEATVNDLVVVFYAGHGLLDKKLDYFLSTAATDFHHPEEQSILYTDLENIVARCKSRKKLFLLDACHSGELDKESMQAGNSTVKVITGNVTFRGAQTEMEMGNNKAFELSRALFADVDRSAGTAIISSASGAELAMEGDAWNNGLFTHVVLTGLRSKKADLNGDRSVQVSELLYYVNERVKTLTKGKQNPNGRAENIYYDFTVR